VDREPLSVVGHVVAPPSVRAEAEEAYALASLRVARALEILAGESDE